MSIDKQEAQKQWNATPCGTGEHTVNVPYKSLEFFEEIRRNRYEVTDQWMKRVINCFRYQAGITNLLTGCLIIKGEKVSRLNMTAILNTFL